MTLNDFIAEFLVFLKDEHPYFVFQLDKIMYEPEDLDTFVIYENNIVLSENHWIELFNEFLIWKER